MIAVSIHKLSTHFGMSIPLKMYALTIDIYDTLYLNLILKVLKNFSFYTFSRIFG